MLLRSFLLAAATACCGCASARPCVLEQNCGCAVPGVTLRWKAAYCMSLEQTDDLEQAGVQRCLEVPDPPAVTRLAACEQNRHWKALLCGGTRAGADTEACVRDEAFVPSIVRDGPGSKP